MEDTKFTPTVEAAQEMYEALEQIANMEPGESETSDDGCHYYTESCWRCYEMIGIAQATLKKIRGEA